MILLNFTKSTSYRKLMNKSVKVSCCSHAGQQSSMVQNLQRTSPFCFIGQIKHTELSAQQSRVICWRLRSDKIPKDSTENFQENNLPTVSDSMRVLLFQLSPHYRGITQIPKEISYCSKE
jgi:hypothetical protein